MAQEKNHQQVVAVLSQAPAPAPAAAAAFGSPSPLGGERREEEEVGEGEVGHSEQGLEEGERRIAHAWLGVKVGVG